MNQRLTDIGFHPVCNIFPMMQAEESEDLLADIKENGLLEPIWLHPDGRIIDGKNRYRACLEIGIEPSFKTWDGHGSLVSFVVSLNLHRRHLSSSQKAAIAVEVVPLLAKEIEEERRKKISKYRRTSEKSQEIDSSGKNQNRAAQQAAQLLGTNRQYVSDARKLRDQDPTSFQQVLSGEKTITQVKRQKVGKRRQERRDKNKRLAESCSNPLTIGAKFPTIVVDAPWDYRRDEDDADPFGRGLPTYHTLSFEEIANLPVNGLADVDCHLYLWITNRFLREGFRLLEEWGFRYITCLTWCKPSFGMGNYFRSQTEHILFGVKGSQPLKRKDVGTWFQAPRGPDGHSSKPVEFYKLVESCSPGPYLEMFARSPRASWTSWGAEV
ncbi:MT-A70 family methyltransferase [Acidobacteria bacterium AH-259-G07]|nr:MT-A70 family methyltransferase [Acidobacteria bacterium AH-259-G07]